MHLFLIIIDFQIATQEISLYYEKQRLYNYYFQNKTDYIDTLRLKKLILLIEIENYHKRRTLDEKKDYYF